MMSMPLQYLRRADGERNVMITDLVAHLPIGLQHCHRRVSDGQTWGGPVHEHKQDGAMPQWS